MSDRFDFAALEKAGKVLCAVSGGADSVYLLHRCLEGAAGHGYAVCAAHYDHGLRGEESGRDSRFVADMCRELGVECLTGRGDVRSYARERRLGTEEAARELRYAFLQEAAGSWARSSSPRRTTPATTRRPCCWPWRAARACAAWAASRPGGGTSCGPCWPSRARRWRSISPARGIAHVEDSTNALDDYARNRLRHHVLPLLRELNPRFDTAAARAAALLRADEDFLESLARDFLRENADENGLSAAALAAAPRSVASRAVRILAPCALSEAHVDAVLALAEGEGAAFADVPGARCARQNGRLRFFTSLPGAIEPRVLRAGEEFALPESGLYVKCSDSVYSGEINSSFNTFFFPYANICGTIYCMSGQPGDKLRIARRGCTKKLSDLFAEARIPALSRALVPVFRDDAGVLAVYGPGAGRTGRAARRREGAESGDKRNIERERDFMAERRGMENDIERVLFTEEELKRRVKELGGQLTRDFADKDPVFVGVLKGCFVFMADLLRSVDMHCTMDFMAVSSYGSGTTTTGAVKINKDLSADIEGRHVIIVEDILDSGVTLSYLTKYLEGRAPASISLVTLLDKPARRRADVRAGLRRLSISEDAFVVGYGLDYAEQYRNLPYIGVLKPEIYENAGE